MSVVPGDSAARHDQQAGSGPDMRGEADLSARQLRWGLAAAYGLHLLIVALFVFSVIPQEFHPPEHLFWLHNGGDNVAYYDLAHQLRAGELAPPSKYPLGYPLLLLPFVLLFPHYTQPELMQVIAAFWGLIMFPIGQFALARLALRLLGRRWLALLTVLGWTALPLVLYGGLRLVASPQVAETGSVHLTWLQMLSDGPAALGTLLIMLAYLRLRETQQAWRWALLVGWLGGFLALIRLTAVLAVGGIGLLLLGERRWREAALVALAALLAFAPQMLYNLYFFGGVLTSGYTVLDNLPPLGLFHPAYLLDAAEGIWQRSGLLLPVLLGALAVAGAGLGYLWRRSPIYALLIGLLLIGYLAVYSLYYYSWTGGLLRFLIPVYPPGMIVVGGALGQGAALAARRTRDSTFPPGAL